MNDDRKLDVLVTYPKSGDELRDNNAKRKETLGSLRGRALIAFGLQEGEEHGKLTTYSLFHGDHELTNLDRTLGDIAGNHELLTLELARERYRFFFVEDKISSNLAVATGAQIKEMIKATVPAFDVSHELILEGHGAHADKAIADGESVSLEAGQGHPIKHFFSKPPTNFGA
ncbi:MAG: hypothetical protein WDM94_01260 [Bauldia sp.]